MPYGHQKGQSHGFSYCYFRKGKQFRLVASLDEKPGYTILRYDSGKALLTLERDCAGVEHPGGSFPLFDLFFAEGSETEVFDGWFQAMGITPSDGEEAGRLFQLVQPLSGHHRGHHPGGS